MSSKQKKLMLLGGIRYLLPVIEAAHKMGVWVITADYLPDNIAHKYSDEYVNVSIIDREVVLKVAREKQIDGILSFGVDPGVVTAAYVAEQLGLPTPPLKSVEILQNKDRFRDFLEANGFNCPWHKGYTKKEDALQECHSFTYPVIVKPVDSAGSKGCTRVNAAADLSAAIDMALSESHNGRFIIEQFLEKVGCSSDSDCFSIDDELVFCSFNCQHFDASSPNPYTPAGFSWPSDMPQEAQDELRSELQRLIKLLHLGSSIYNVETRLATDGKPYIMEVSPRGGGNRLAEMLLFACGQDLIANAVRVALSEEPIPLTQPIFTRIWAELILHSNQTGTYQHLEINDSFRGRVFQEDLWVKSGDVVYEFTGANQTIGTLVMNFNTHEEAEDTILNVHDWLKIELVK